MKINDSTKTVTITSADAEFLKSWQQHYGHEKDSIFDALSAIRDAVLLSNSDAAGKSLDALKNASSIIIGTDFDKGPSFALPDFFFANSGRSADFISPLPDGPRVTVGSSVTEIGAVAFCDFKMNSVYCESSDGAGPLIMGDGAFEFTSLKTFESDRPLHLGYGAFMHNFSLRDVCFNDRVDHVPAEYFNDWVDGLPAECFDDPVNGVSAECFNDCSNLRSVSFGLSDMSLNEAALDTGTGDPSGMSVDAYAFTGCECLENVHLSDGLYISDVGDSAFRKTSSLRLLDLSKASSVGKSAFCDSGLDIEESRVGNLKSVGENAFAGCKCPGTLTFSPDAVISDSAFPDYVKIKYGVPEYRSLSDSAAMFSLEEDGPDGSAEKNPISSSVAMFSLEEDGPDGSVKRNPIPSGWQDLVDNSEEGNGLSDTGYDSPAD